MEVSCFVPGCPEHPSLVCYCNTIPSFFCAQHYGIHVTQSRGLNHLPINLEMGVNENNRLEFIQFLERLLNKEMKIKTQVLSLVQKITEESQLIISESNKISTRLKKLIKSIKMKGTVFCIPDKKLEQNKNCFDIEDLNNLKLNSKEYRKRDWKYFKFYGSDLSFFYNEDWDKITHDSLYFFKDCTNELIGLNLNDLTDIRNQISYYKGGISNPCILQIDKDNLFIHGGSSRSGIKYNDTVLINLKTMKHEKLPDGISKSCLKPILIYQKIFIFGGYSSQVFDLKLKIWKSISSLPGSYIDTSSISFNEKILISSSNNDSLYLYNISNNNYETIRIGITISYRNILLKHKQKVFLLSEKIYESSSNYIDQWIEVNNFGLTGGNIITAGILKNKNFYFADWRGSIFKFDLKNKALYIIKNI